MHTHTHAYIHLPCTHTFSSTWSYTCLAQNYLYADKNISISPKYNLMMKFHVSFSFYAFLQVDDILQFILENDTLEVEDTVQKYSDELSAKVIFWNSSQYYKTWYIHCYITNTFILWGGGGGCCGVESMSEYVVNVF